MWKKQRNVTGRTSDERGQSLVLVAFMLIGLLAIVGIAVDVGFVFARGAQLQAAVDAAALAGVTELAGGDLSRANVKAGQFLNANGMPITVTTSLESSSSRTPLGAIEYSLTVRWPVELYFLRLLNRDSVTIARSATAAFFPLADIYASRRIEDGVLSTSNQGIFGPRICTNLGDPFSPLNSQWHPGPYTYTYRILLPLNYPSNVLRVELFDPDSINRADNEATIEHSDTAVARGMPGFSLRECAGGGRSRINPCLIPTGELDLLATNPDLDLDQINPYWFVRIDENRAAARRPATEAAGPPEPTPPASTRPRSTSCTTTCATTTGPSSASTWRPTPARWETARATTASTRPTCAGFRPAGRPATTSRCSCPWTPVRPKPLSWTSTPTWPTS
jgi:hypothetical protein